MLFHKKIKRPDIICVEPTNNCNLNCPFCLVGLQGTLPSVEHRLLPRQLGFMEFGLFEKIIRDSVGFGVKTIQLHFQGEPLLHKRFVDMVRLSKRNGLVTQVSTNGLLLSGDLAGRLIEAGLDSMRFSVDGATEETYQKNRPGGSFEQVYGNMRTAVDKARGTQLKLVWQFIAMRNNEHEIEKAKGMAAELGIEFYIKTFAQTAPDMAPANPAYRRKLLKKPCADIYRILYIFYNGDVVICCYDIEGKYVVGNIKNNTLLQIWNSKVYRGLRSHVDRALSCPGEEPLICKTCLKWGNR